MSDIFDHALDAYEDLADYHTGRREHHGEDSGYSYNPLFYHTKVEFISIQAETEKAYLLLESKFEQEVWVPKSICRKMDKDNCTVYIHRTTYYAIMQAKAQEVRHERKC